MIIMHIIVIMLKNNTGKIADLIVPYVTKSKLHFVTVTNCLCFIFYVFETFLTCRYMIINMYHLFKYEENNCLKLSSCVLLMTNKGCPVCYSGFGNTCK